MKKIYAQANRKKKKTEQFSPLHSYLISSYLPSSNRPVSGIALVVLNSIINVTRRIVLICQRVRNSHTGTNM